MRASDHDEGCYKGRCSPAKHKSNRVCTTPAMSWEKLDLKPGIETEKNTNSIFRQRRSRDLVVPHSALRAA